MSNPGAEVSPSIQSGHHHNSFCVNFVSPGGGARTILYDVAMGIPALAFVAFLAWNLKKSLRKLQRSQSHIMTTYYAFLWLISLLNLLRCCIQVGQVHHIMPTLWNIMWLVTRCGMILLEVSVVVFLLQGYLSSGVEALVRTVYTAGTIAGVDALVKVLMIFALHIPLFLYRPGPDYRADMSWEKWGFWLLHSGLFALVYAGILILPQTRWRDVLPAKPSFYHYTRVLLAINVVSMLGAALIGFKVLGGYCVYGLSNWVYFAAYPPLLYMTFLAEFLADEELDMDMLYYAEMRDAGCFDTYDDDDYYY